jgi:hypothetical protein
MGVSRDEGDRWHVASVFQLEAAKETALRRERETEDAKDGPQASSGQLMFGVESGAVGGKSCSTSFARCAALVEACMMPTRSNWVRR